MEEVKLNVPDDDPDALPVDGEEADKPEEEVEEHPPADTPAEGS